MDYFKSSVEVSKRNELNQLMDDWRKVISTKDEILFPENNQYYPAIEYFNADGFFPGYFSRGNLKVLFIGRESRYCSGGDRIIGGLEWFKENNPNSSPYWRRLLYIVYGIQNGGKIPYEQVPYADQILAQMNSSNNYGFAIMNISKYSNDQDDGASANFQLINQFLKDSDLDKRNFIREEIELLEPDIIITANLWECGISKPQLEKIIPTPDCSYLRSVPGVANLMDFKMNGRVIKMIDLYHFSSRGSDKEYFYDPVMQLVFGRR